MIYKRMAWWYWLATTFSLGAEMGGWPRSGWFAIGITVANMIHCAIADGRSFPLQVRGTYLVMLVLGAWRPLFFLHVIQLIGTSALVIVDYCFLARCLSLLPWNRKGALDLQKLKATFLSPPVRGSFVESRPATSG